MCQVVRDIKAKEIVHLTTSGGVGKMDGRDALHPRIIRLAYDNTFFSYRTEGGCEEWVPTCKVLAVVIERQDP